MFGQFAGLCHSAKHTSCCNIKILPFDNTAYLLRSRHRALFRGNKIRDNFQVSHPHHEYRQSYSETKLLMLIWLRSAGPSGRAVEGVGLRPLAC
jgi:hypothetical protein